MPTGDPPMMPGDIHFMPGPVKYWRSREQLLDAAKSYMLDRFGTPGMLDADERDRWYERLGMLVDFVESKLTSNCE